MLLKWPSYWYFTRYVVYMLVYVISIYTQLFVCTYIYETFPHRWYIFLLQTKKKGSVDLRRSGRDTTLSDVSGQVIYIEQTFGDTAQIFAKNVYNTAVFSCRSPVDVSKYWLLVVVQYSHIVVLSLQQLASLSVRIQIRHTEHFTVFPVIFYCVHVNLCTMLVDNNKNK